HPPGSTHARPVDGTSDVEPFHPRERVTHAGESLARLRLLLTGDATARPDGLERALTRAGFSIGESAGAAELRPDAILTTLADAHFDRLSEVLADASAEPPRVIVFAAEDRDG